MPLDIDVSTIKIKKGKLPPVAAGRGGKVPDESFAALCRLIEEMEPDSYIVVPTTAHKPDDDAGAKRYHYIRGRLSGWMRKSGIEGVALAKAAADNALLVRKTAELVDARNGRPIDSSSPPARQKAQPLRA